MTETSANKPQLIDRFGREVTYVRLSVTDRCDLRCVYCMSEDMKFVPREQLLTLEEMNRIGKAFVDLGVNKIRLTGGEPLTRRNILSVFESLGELDGLKDLTVTTNGTLFFESHLPHPFNCGSFHCFSNNMWSHTKTC